MSTILKTAGVVVVAGVALGAYVATRRPASPFDSASAQRERTPAADAEYAARLGDCVACHSTPEGKPFAGGLAMGTPLGVIYSTNITFDAKTGIGDYTLADFDNAVRRGVARDGHRLYPAMPYPSYAKLSDDDVKRLYDYFKYSVQPAEQANKPSTIAPPYNWRWPIAFWNIAFVDDKPFAPRAGHDDAWNRGAYLVQGFGHCGSCHTPRGAAFQEVALTDAGADYLSGAQLDGWRAASLRGEKNIGLGRWTADDVKAFLLHGRNAHGIVYGSMLDAFNNSAQYLSDADASAVAAYLKSLPPAASEGAAWTYDDSTAKSLAAGAPPNSGAALYLKHCVYCHGVDGKGTGDQLAPLAGNPTLLDNDASSVVNIVLNGAGHAVENGEPDAYRMGPFRVQLSDADVAAVATFVRSAWGNKAPAVPPALAKSLRASTNPSSDDVTILKMR
jgi:mono/diheme cytochrome c family protein